VNSGVIDNFLGVFTQYIDSGFGLLGPEVGFLARTLVLIDIILAALFWSWAGDEDIIARLVKKTLFVGVFAYLISNWQMLSRVLFESFAALGLKASGTGLSEADFLRPGRVAQVGLDAGQPILQSISGLMGFVSFFENFIQITVLLFAWAIVLISFFVLAIQLFVSLIEFKLSTLCGFVLIPFGLFGKTAFAAERVLGNVISSGVKVLVLAVIVGIGSTLFSQFTTSFPATPTIADAMGLVLASLSLLGLGIFGPGIGCCNRHRHCGGRRCRRGSRRRRFGCRRCRCGDRRRSTWRRVSGRRICGRVPCWCDGRERPERCCKRRRWDGEGRSPRCRRQPLTPRRC
jgi:type IV secretion system protein TrbL